MLTVSTARVFTSELLVTVQSAALGLYVQLLLAAGADIHTSISQSSLNSCARKRQQQNRATSRSCSCCCCTKEQIGSCTVRCIYSTVAVAAWFGHTGTLAVQLAVQLLLGARGQPQIPADNLVLDATSAASRLHYETCAWLLKEVQYL
jgi:hypothetical protein